MRPDFKHLLCERPRYGGHYHTRIGKGVKKSVQQEEALDYEEWASGGKASMRHQLRQLSSKEIDFLSISE